MRLGFLSSGVRASFTSGWGQAFKGLVRAGAKVRVRY